MTPQMPPHTGRDPDLPGTVQDDDRPLIGVLSPFVGGPFYGDLLNGMQLGAERTHSRLLVVQTLDAGSFRAHAHTIPDRPLPVAHDHVDGFVLPIGAVGPGYVEELCATGKDVVLIGFEAAGLPSVQADNASGVATAVTHLLGHGHTRIAFAGYREMVDVEERYQGYAQALRTAGIEPDPALCYAANDNLEEGGEAAAAAMIADGLPSTAVVCGTDLNAIGLMRVLRAHGHRLPDDQAVIGFDDIDRAAYEVPSLATVAQPTAAMGSSAVELLHRRRITGRDPGGPNGRVTAERVRVATTFVARASCGCPDDGWTAADEAAAGTPEQVLRERLTRLLPPGSASAQGDRHRVAGVADGIARAVLAARDDRPREPVAHLLGDVQALIGLRHQRGTVELISEAIQGFADAVAPVAHTPASVVHRVAVAVRELTVLLARTEEQLIFTGARALGQTVDMHYEVTMDLLHSPDQDPTTLAWMRHTFARGGCLGLWTAPATPELTVAGVYERDERPRTGGQNQGRSADTCLSVSAFPPPQVIAMARDPEDVVLVVPAKVNESDWGLLTFVGPLQTRIENGRESPYQCTALLTVALDLRQKEAQLRRAALHDPLTGLANRTLFTEQLERSVTQAAHRSNYHFAVLFLDLDGFKEINDTYGHAVGDEVLVQVARRIGRVLRGHDLAARFGGDEFVVLLDGLVAPSDAARVAERFSLTMIEPLDVAGRRLKVGMSVGVATSEGRPGSAEEVLRSADAAMYRVKQARALGA